MKRDQIRGAVTSYGSGKPKTVSASAFGADFVLHKLSYAELQEARAGGMKGEVFDATQHLLAMIVMSAQDEDGQPVFERTDLEMLLQSDGAEMDKLVQAVLALNDLGVKAHQEGKES
jgi:hypothetical protein